MLKYQKTMLVYQKTMFDCYYCIKSFCFLNLFGKTLKSSIFVLPIIPQTYEGFVGFKNACSRAKTYAILTLLNYVHDLVRMRIHISSKKASTACELPDKYMGLFHGFVLVKAWLLIACDTAFYAIIMA